jgi:hypothetical protein
VPVPGGHHGAERHLHDVGDLLTTALPSGSTSAPRKVGGGAPIAADAYGVPRRSRFQGRGRRRVRITLVSNGAHGDPLDATRLCRAGARATARGAPSSRSDEKKRGTDAGVLTTSSASGSFLASHRA